MRLPCLVVAGAVDAVAVGLVWVVHSARQGGGGFKFLAGSLRQPRLGQTHIVAKLAENIFFDPAQELGQTVRRESGGFAVGLLISRKCPADH